MKSEKEKRLEKEKTGSEYPGNCGAATEVTCRGVTEGEETERRNRNKSEEIITENIPKLMSESKLQIQEVQGPSGRIHAVRKLPTPQIHLHIS